MAVNKLIKDLPVKYTVYGGDKILIDDGITKTSFLSSLQGYFATASSVQDLFYDKTYLSITAANTVPLSAFNKVNVEQQILSANNDLLSIFVLGSDNQKFNNVDIEGNLLSGGQNLFDIFSTTDQDNQNLGFDGQYLTISPNGNTVPLSSFSNLNTNAKFLSSNVDLLSIFAPTAAVTQTLSASEEYLNISNSNSVPLSTLNNTKYRILKINSSTRPVSTVSSIFDSSLLLKANKTYEISYSVLYNNYNNNTGMVFNIFILSADNSFNFINCNYTFANVEFNNSVTSINLANAKPIGSLIGNDPVLPIIVQYNNNSNYCNDVTGRGDINIIAMPSVDTNLTLAFSGSHSLDTLSARMIPLMGSYIKITPIE